MSPFKRLTLLLARSKDDIGETRETLTLLIFLRYSHRNSVAHRLWGNLDIHDLEVRQHSTPLLAYGNAKLENLLFPRERHYRSHEQGIARVAFQRDNVATNFAADSSNQLRWIYHTPLKHLVGLLSPQQVANTLLWLASTSAGKKWQSGEYYKKRKPAKMLGQTDDPILAMALWQESENTIINQ